MIGAIGRAVLAAAMVCFGVPAHAATVEAILGPSFNLNFSTTGGLSYQVDLPSQSADLSIPKFSEFNQPGRLRSVSFVEGSSTLRYDIDAFFQGQPNPEAVEERWAAHGNHTMSGTMRLLADNVVIGSQSFVMSTFAGTCTGVAPGGCTWSNEIAFDNSPDFTGFDLGSIDGSELVSLRLALDDVKVSGSFNRDSGLIAGGEYSGQFTLRGDIYVLYDYTPISEVPLPGAAWLFLSALGALGFNRFRRARG